MNSKASTYDAAGRMGFGKYEFTKFEKVPEDYLAWCYDEMSHENLRAFYPNFWKYLKERGY
jgi:uncharacterized protein (DUF3820 family)